VLDGTALPDREVVYQVAAPGVRFSAASPEFFALALNFGK
jgi:hypothetical protein